MRQILYTILKRIKNYYIKSYHCKSFSTPCFLVLIPVCSPIIQPYQAAGQNANVKTNENERIQQRTQRCRQRRRRLRRRQAKEWAASQVLDGIALCRIASQELSARPKILYVHTYSPSRAVPPLSVSAVLR